MSEDKKLKDELLGEDLLDHNYDGIMELDNDLPPWWLYMFYGTIIAAIIYLIAFFGMGKFNQLDEYAAEISSAEANKAIFHENFGGSSINENTAIIVTQEDQLADGKEIYLKFCVACHLENGGGSVGPNFTDEYWLHGNTINDLFKTIKFGVPEKGMIPWESQLNSKQMQNVASYILTEFKNKNIEGGKEPQGDKL